MEAALTPQSAFKIWLMTVQNQSSRFELLSRVQTTNCLILATTQHFSKWYKVYQFPPLQAFTPELSCSSTTVIRFCCWSRYTNSYTDLGFVSDLQSQQQPAEAPRRAWHPRRLADAHTSQARSSEYFQPWPTRLPMRTAWRRPSWLFPRHRRRHSNSPPDGPGPSRSLQSGKHSLARWRRNRCGAGPAGGCCGRGSRLVKDSRRGSLSSCRGTGGILRTSA